MEDNCIFYSVMCSVQGPPANHALNGDNSNCCKSATNLMPFTLKMSQPECPRIMICLTAVTL